MLVAFNFWVTEVFHSRTFLFVIRARWLPCTKYFSLKLKNKKKLVKKQKGPSCRLSAEYSKKENLEILY